ncbi:MAG: radical SAM family heme chaperone HemW [Bacteroidales bacterium]|nr:radical SAM family heme chaperone HemW [Bacteroidales bacterium]
MIYIHVPFCRSFCTYCDFYSEVAARCRQAEDERRQADLFSRFAEAAAAEIKARRDEITDEVNTLYIGGGTPSVLPLSAYETLLSALKEAGHGGPYEEFTVEVNPDDIVSEGHAYVERLLELGVNRISMGVQSFDDRILKFMNRRHDVLTARKAYAILEEAGVGNISIDLIFGLPQLSDAGWRDSLKQALDISAKGSQPHHISSYQLSVEPGSALAGMVEKGLWTEASEELCMRQYDILCSTLREAGYSHYEISNFALPGFEARHNSAYWRHVPYAGFGPGAHSFRTGHVKGEDVSVRQWNKPDLKLYLEDPAGATEFEVLTDEQVVMEHIMLGLRTSEGLPEAYLREHCIGSVLDQAVHAGSLVRSSSGMMRIPEDRFFVSDGIIAGLV